MFFVFFFLKVAKEERQILHSLMCSSHQVLQVCGHVGASAVRGQETGKRPGEEKGALRRQSEEVTQHR